MKHHTAPLHPDRRYLLSIALVAIAVYAVVPQLGGFHKTWRLINHSDPAWLLGAFGLAGLTYLAAAATYCLLAFKRLGYARTVLVQLAAMFVNRLLPAGIGGLSANYLYLKRSRHSPAQATSVVALNNLLGFVGHTLILLVFMVVFSAEMVGGLRGHHTDPMVVRYSALALLAVTTVILWRRRQVMKFVRDIIRQLGHYARRPHYLAAALLSSMCLTTLNVLSLYASMQAIGLDLNYVAVFLIFSFAQGAATATPTPGGLGGFEAGVVAGFVAYHVDASTALAIALLYRVISYWLPLLVGGAAFAIAQRRHYFVD